MNSSYGLPDATLLYFDGSYAILVVEQGSMKEKVFILEPDHLEMVQTDDCLLGISRLLVSDVQGLDQCFRKMTLQLYAFSWREVHHNSKLMQHTTQSLCNTLIW